MNPEAAQSPRPNTIPELLAPAGNWECARAAAANGADAIYFGAPEFNARMRADNFTLEDIPALMRFLHGRGMRGYATLNVLIFSGELDEAARLIDHLAESGVDALIVQDLGIARLAAAAGVEVHASTQMTVTSPEGVAFARGLGVSRVVLARETSLREMERFRTASEGLPLEVFVHGALCVAYSGQCLTSEALGQRSANRGECAQACRLPYQLIVDGALRDLGDRRFLLSPQDLAAVDEIPRLIALGVASFKIEGRLKSPEYVAAVTSVYRKAIDAALDTSGGRPPQTLKDSPDTRYKLEMAFSRGLFSGWMHGVDHQRLVHARFGKKRGAFLGRVKAVAGNHILLLDPPAVPVRPGDGVVFDQGGDTDNETGGRVFAAQGVRIEFGRGLIDLSRIRPGDLLWKTDDPALRRELRKSFERLDADTRFSIELKVVARCGRPMMVSARSEDGREVTIESALPLEPARNRPLTPELLREQFGRLGETPFRLRNLECDLSNEPLLLPLSEISALRRRLVAALIGASPQKSAPRSDAVELLHRQLAEIPRSNQTSFNATGQPRLAILCRTEPQMKAALEAGISEVHLDFEDIRRFKPAVAGARTLSPQARIFLATPRIQKPAEAGFFKLLTAAEPDGILVRNLGGLDFFKDSGLDLTADFSLNAANPLTSAVLMSAGVSRIVPSFDLDAAQLAALLRSAPPSWFQVVIHQHIPMFHMEHCVFAAFLSEGKDHLTCGRPCDRHRIALRDRVGQEHPVSADVGCRNTVFHGRPQSAAFALDFLLETGAADFRIDLLRETGEETASLIRLYRELLEGRISPEKLIADSRAAGQLGVTGGTLTVLAR